MIVEFFYIWTPFELWPLRLHCGCWCLRIEDQTIYISPPRVHWVASKPKAWASSSSSASSSFSFFSAVSSSVSGYSILGINNVIFTFSLGTFHLTLWVSSFSAGYVFSSMFRYCGSKKEEDAEIGLVKNGEVTVEFILSKDMKSNPFFLIIN